MVISWWVSESLLSLSSSPVALVPLVVSWTLMMRVMVGEHGTYGAYVVLPVASMVRVLSLAIGGVTYVGRTWRWWQGCCR